MDRRSFLARVVGVATPLVAGCLGGPGRPTDTPTRADASTAAATATPTATASPTATPTPTEPPGPAAVVSLQNGNAIPSFAGIDAGGTVQWVNEDPFPHVLAATKFHEHAEDWELGPVELASGQSVTHTFEERGQYEYYGRREGQDSLCGAVTVEVALGEPLPCR